MSWVWKSVLTAAVLVVLAPQESASQNDLRDSVRAPPPTQRAPPIRSDEIAPPREVRGLYIVIAQTMHCRHETHWDWMGSDDTFFVFRDPVSASAVMTAAFRNVDAGDTRGFTPAQSCVTPLANFLEGPNNRPLSWTCGQGVPNISFVVEAYEDDEDEELGTRSYYSYGDSACTDAQAPANCADDLIGRATVRYSAEQLEQLVPQVGLTRHFTVRLGGYDFTFAIQRVANVTVDPPVEARQ